MAGRSRILISGKAGKLQDAIVGALGGRSGFAPEAVPPGPRLLELAQSGSCAGAIFVLGRKHDLEPIRWLIEGNSSLPLIAVLSNGSAQLRRELQAEGVSEVFVARGLSGLELRRRLLQQLRAAASAPMADAAITTDLHGIRSSLTAIQGQAELALTEARRSSSRRQPLQEIVREVGVVERLLRRIERKITASRALPPK
jgi:signal transduction histidine kinase